MRSDNGADAVNGILILSQISVESCVNCFFKGFETVSYGNNSCAEHLHTYNVGMLLCNVDFTHVDVALESEICCCSGKGNAVLTCTGFGNDLLFAHIFSQKSFAHAVVELVSACMVEVFSLKINLAAADFS